MEDFDGEDDDDWVEDDQDEAVERIFLTFRVGHDEFAVAVQHVSEIVRLPRLYVMPDVPRYIRGVANLRGQVVPLLDLRRRFGLSEGELTDRSVAVVVEHDQGSTGLIVDAVGEVVEIVDAQVDVQIPARFGSVASAVYGVARRPGGLTLMVDVGRMINAVVFRGAGEARFGSASAEGH